MIQADNGVIGAGWRGMGLPLFAGLGGVGGFGVDNYPSGVVSSSRLGLVWFGALLNDASSMLLA